MSTPTLLESLLATGTIFIDRTTENYIGIASDGFHVQLGNIGTEADIEDYLKTRPLPEQW